MDSTFTFPRAANRGRTRAWIRGFCAAFVSVSLAGGAFAASEPSLVTGQKRSYAYSWEQEVKLGAEADKEITESMGLYDNPGLQTYIDAVGQRLLQQSEFAHPNAPAIYRNTKFTFRVIDSPVVNAFALPGGYVYVTRGLLAHVQNEAQLAVVLGHEIAHVAARHSSQQARRSQWTQLGVIAGAILGQKVLGEKMPNLAPTILQAGGQAAQMFLLRYSREAEHESDQLGVGYATRAGYAAEHSARFFHSLQRLAANEGKSLPAWQSTHPDPGNRAQRVQQLAGAVPAEQRANVGEEAYLNQIQGIMVGENPREGFAHNGVFYHPELRFQLPVAAGWKLDNQRAAVVMAEPSGRAMMGLKLAPGARARDAAMQFAQQSKVQVLTSGDTTVNGLPATVIIGQGSTEDGQVGVWNAFIEYNGRVYSLLGYAPQNAFEQVRPTFEQVAAGFSPLRDERMAAVQPSRLKIVRADRQAPFASFVPTSLPREVSADTVALMNQVTLNDAVNEGRMIKIPETPPQPALPATPEPTQSPASGQPYPGSTYPPQSYPPPSSYPSQPSAGYPPPQSYPPPGNSPSQSGYPSSYPPSYPSGQPGQSYPPQQYPQPAPGSTGYPSTSYPPGQYPPSQYPPSQYPPGSSGYPQSSYPPPATGQPSGPQFPQPPSPGTQRNPSTSQPTWPR